MLKNHETSNDLIGSIPNLKEIKPGKNPLGQITGWEFSLSTALKIQHCVTVTGALQAQLDGRGLNFRLNSLSAIFRLNYDPVSDVFTFRHSSLGRVLLVIRFRIPERYGSPVEVLTVESAYDPAQDHRVLINAVFSSFESELNKQTREK
jgi:hypothetical protein